MSFLDKLVNVATGGLAQQIFSTVEKYFPPDLSPEKKAAIQLEMEKVQLEREKSVAAAQVEADRALTERISAYEGTASDLKSIPYLGALMLFLRGSQRPVYGFGTLYLDYNVFSGAWTLTDPTIVNAFWLINLLVLIFLFGERAVTNVLPLFLNLMQARSAGVK